MERSLKNNTPGRIPCKTPTESYSFTGDDQGRMSNLFKRLLPRVGGFMIWGVNATYVEKYKIKITFNDGLVKIVDLSEELDEGVFAPLRDIDTFKKFHISANTIEWENGADFAPEFLRGLPSLDDQKMFEKQRTG
jgi:hypothetical protein